MKKKPSVIFSILINTLNNLDLNTEYSVNEISEKSGLHWQTTNEYLKILMELIKFSPKIKLNVDNNKFRIIEHSDFFKKLSINQQILIHLYENKAYNAENALRIDQIYPSVEEETFLNDLLLKKQIRYDSTNGKYYLTKMGKSLVISIYSDLSKGIFNFTEIHSETKSPDQKYLTLIEKLVQQNERITNQVNLISSHNKRLLTLLINIFQIMEENLTKGANTQPLFQIKEIYNQIIPHPKNVNFINVSNLPDEFSSNSDINQLSNEEILEYCLSKLEAGEKSQEEKLIEIE
ncbi:MAG: hypothetical protein ACXABO_12245 [Promethearchaeota archaeon]